MRPIRVVVIDRNDITRKGVEGIVSDAGDPFQVATTFVRLREVEKYLKEQAVEVITRFYPLERFPQKTLHALGELLPKQG